MILEMKTPEELLNKAHVGQTLANDSIELFRRNLSALCAHLQDGDREGHQKDHIRDFLKDTWYRKTNLVASQNTGDIDLAIYADLSTSVISVIIETKSSTNTTEMMSRQKPNAKALHEIILYYLREVFDKENYAIKYLIATNTNEWFVFDGAWFERNIRRNKSLEKGYKAFKRDGHDSRYFYESIAKKWLDELEEPIPCCWFDLRDYHTLAQKPALTEKDRKKLIALYKFLSPQHLLKLPIANDSNSLNNEFYSELLHIVGLEEVKEKGKKLIRRKAPERRNEGSLLENTINLLKVQQGLEGIKNLQEYGSDEEEQYFSAALELCITWLNRILFLKLLEGRLIAWHQGDTRFVFLNKERIKDFDDLQELFFEVLARQESERTNDIKNKFGNIPYLNSSLFEVSQLERCALQISSLKHRLTLPLFPATVLKNEAGKRRSGVDNTLFYLFDFLDSYDFASEGKALVKDVSKTIINASVLGLIFEKINGYRDGSFYTPGYITMYMSREAIRRAVVEKFRTSSCLPGMQKLKDFDDLKDQLDASDRDVRKLANEVVNSLRVCDPAVGSGHFLVSALNELIVIKYELRILSYRNNGDRIKGYRIAVENDELVIISTEDDQLFRYRLNKNGRPIEDLHCLQETLFHEKETIIENCLFGVDINPKSVAICRLRLWIELLKNAYYRDEDRLETLPNIDINIKCGNSLISRFSLNDDSSGLAHYAPVERRRFKELTKQYKEKVWFYKLGEKGPSNKSVLRRDIEVLKEQWRKFSLPSDFYMKELMNVKNELAQAIFAFDEVGHQKREKLHQRAAELEEKIDARQQTVYANAFEWRFEFPEVLDEDGHFTGFDVVIGNPPYIRQEELGTSKPHLKDNYITYSGTADLYVFFVERAFDLMGDGGYFSYIMPNKWMKAAYGLGLRTFFKKNQLIQIDDFGDLQVFDEATTYPCIVQARNADAKASFWATEISTLDVQQNFSSYIYENRFEVAATMLSDDSWTLTGSNRLQILNRLKETHANLAGYIEDEAYYGIKTGLTEAFVIDAVTCNSLIAEHENHAEILRPFLLGRNIKPYGTPTVDKYLIFLPKGITNTRRRESEPEAWLQETFPGIYAWLKPFQERAEKRTDKGDYWWEIRACDYYHAFAKPKIMYQKFQVKPCFIYDEQGRFCNDSMWIIPKADKTLFAILNSRMGWFLISSYCTAIQNGFQLIFKYFGQIPIPKTITPEQQKTITELVDQILAAKKVDPKSNTADLEKQIDCLIYTLYGLTPEEIVLVEGTA